jgi:hypothetical protein
MEGEGHKQQNGEGGHMNKVNDIIAASADVELTRYC